MNALQRSLLAGLFAAGAAVAQTPLTLQEAVRLALQRNPEVRIAEAQVDEIEGKIREVRADAFPQVNLEGFGLRLRDPSILNSSSFDRVPPEFREALVPRAANLFDVAVTVKQPIYTAGKVRNAIRLAEEGREEKEAAMEAVRRQVAHRVFRAFHDILLARENVEVLRETLEQRQKHLEMARSRFSLGVATEIDVLRSEVSVSNLEPDLIRGENGVRLATSALNNLIVVDLPVPTQISGALVYRPWAAPSLAELQTRAIRERPELQVARRQVEEFRLLLEIARAENKLNVDLVSRWGFSSREPRNILDPDFSRWNVTFQFKLPFLDGGRKAGQIVQALARLRMAEQNLARLENDVRLEIQAAHDDMQSAAKAVSASEASVAQAQRVLEMMQANYRYGAATTLDVGDAQTMLTVARNARLRATYDYEMAKARIRFASGMDILEEGENP